MQSLIISVAVIAFAFFGPRVHAAPDVYFKESLNEKNHYFNDAKNYFVLTSDLPNFQCASYQVQCFLPDSQTNIYTDRDDENCQFYVDLGAIQEGNTAFITCRYKSSEADEMWVDMEQVNVASVPKPGDLVPLSKDEIITDGKEYSFIIKLPADPPVDPYIIQIVKNGVVYEAKHKGEHVYSVLFKSETGQDFREGVSAYVTTGDVKISTHRRLHHPHMVVYYSEVSVNGTKIEADVWTYEDIMHHAGFEDEAKLPACFVSIGADITMERTGGSQTKFIFETDKVPDCTVSDCSFGIVCNDIKLRSTDKFVGVIADKQIFPIEGEKDVLNGVISLVDPKQYFKGVLSTFEVSFNTWDAGVMYSAKSDLLSGESYTYTVNVDDPTKLYGQMVITVCGNQDGMRRSRIYPVSFYRALQIGISVDGEETAFKYRFLITLTSVGIAPPPIPTELKYETVKNGQKSLTINRINNRQFVTDYVSDENYDNDFVNNVEVTMTNPDSGYSWVFTELFQKSILFAQKMKILGFVDKNGDVPEDGVPEVGGQMKFQMFYNGGLPLMGSDVLDVSCTIAGVPVDFQYLKLDTEMFLLTLTQYGPDVPITCSHASRHVGISVSSHTRRIAVRHYPQKAELLSVSAKYPALDQQNLISAQVKFMICNHRVLGNVVDDSCTRFEPVVGNVRVEAVGTFWGFISGGDGIYNVDLHAEKSDKWNGDVNIWLDEDVIGRLNVGQRLNVTNVGTYIDNEGFRFIMPLIDYTNPGKMEDIKNSLYVTVPTTVGLVEATVFHLENSTEVGFSLPPKLGKSQHEFVMRYMSDGTDFTFSHETYKISVEMIPYDFPMDMTNDVKVAINDGNYPPLLGPMTNIQGIYYFRRSTDEYTKVIDLKATGDKKYFSGMTSLTSNPLGVFGIRHYSEDETVRVPLKMVPSFKLYTKKPSADIAEKAFRVQLTQPKMKDIKVECKLFNMEDGNIVPDGPPSKPMKYLEVEDMFLCDMTHRPEGWEGDFMVSHREYGFSGKAVISDTTIVEKDMTGTWVGLAFGILVYVVFIVLIVIFLIKPRIGTKGQPLLSSPTKKKPSDNDEYSANSFIS